MTGNYSAFYEKVNVKKIKITMVDEKVKRYPIRPHDINADNLFGTFGKYEVERAAAQLVGYFQWRGAWVGFTLESFLHIARKSMETLTELFLDFLDIGRTTQYLLVVYDEHCRVLLPVATVFGM